MLVPCSTATASRAPTSWWRGTVIQVRHRFVRQQFGAFAEGRREGDSGALAPGEGADSGLRIQTGAVRGAFRGLLVPAPRVELGAQPERGRHGELRIQGTSLRHVADPRPGLGRAGTEHPQPPLRRAEHSSYQCRQRGLAGAARAAQCAYPTGGQPEGAVPQDRMAAAAAHHEPARLKRSWFVAHCSPLVNSCSSAELNSAATSSRASPAVRARFIQSAGSSASGD